MSTTIKDLEHIIEFLEDHELRYEVEADAVTIHYQAFDGKGGMVDQTHRVKTLDEAIDFEFRD